MPWASVASDTKQAGGHSMQAANSFASSSLGTRSLRQSQRRMVQIVFSLAHALLPALRGTKRSSSNVLSMCAPNTRTTQKLYTFCVALKDLTH